MKIFWFYCNEDDPIKYPLCEILFSTDSKRDFWTEQLKNLDDMNRVSKILEIREQISNEFKNELKRLKIQYVGYDDWEIKPKDEMFIQAKDIPLITEALNKAGWAKEYIPFGP